MKKILHIITTINRGGAENQLLVLAGQQIKDGYKVEIVYLKDVPALKDDFEKLGAKVNNFLAGKNPINQIILLHRYLKKYEVIIHAHLPRAQLLVTFSRTSNPIISSRHDAEPFFHNAPKFLSRALALFVDFKSSQQVAISSAVKKSMVERKEVLKNSEVTVVHYGFQSFVPQNQVSPFPKNFDDIAKGKTVFGTAGRLVEQKDYPTLLAGFAEYHKSWPNSLLVIAGAGPLREQLEDYSVQLGLKNHVFWLGGIRALDQFYKRLDVFILASKTEGFGLVLLEAMSYKIPIVASNSTAIPEVLGNAGGMLFEAGNPHELSKTLSSMATEANLEKYSQLSGKRILDFSPEVMSRKITDIYELAVLN